MGLNAKYNTFCTNCRLPIKKGAPIRWSKKKGTRHRQCHLVRVLPKNLDVLRNAQAARFFERVSGELSAEIKLRMRNMLVYGTSHPEFYKGETTQC